MNMDLSMRVKEAWTVKTKRDQQISFFMPGSKLYSNQFYTNQRQSFVNISITGTACSCRCDHCGGKLLETMIPATSPEQFMQLAQRLHSRNCQGILVSGGANRKGEVPLLSFIEAIKYAKDLGLKIVVHTGLLNNEIAQGLKHANVDQVLIDVIADKDTIKSVYHLSLEPQDYLTALQIGQKNGLPLAPHVVIGLHYGEVKGEYKALDMIKQVNPNAVVLVVITPQPGTVMENIELPNLEQVTDVIAYARHLFPQKPVTLGCARPYGLYKRELEKIAVDCGLDGIAYPDEATFTYAQEKGLAIKISEQCCSLISQL